MDSKLNLLFFVLVAAAHATSNQLYSRRHEVPLLKGTNLGIYDGTPTTIQKHNYLAGLLVQGQFYCAANIVSPKWVITLGDCVYGMSADELTIVVGSSDGTTGKSYTVVQVVPHPKYGTATLDYDVACIKVHGKFKWGKTVNFIRLPKGVCKGLTKVVVAGWGSQNSEEVGSNGQLMQGNMTIQKTSLCESAYSGFGFTWTSRMSCAYNKGKTTLCTGDWGNGFINKTVICGMFAAEASSGFCESSAMPTINADTSNPEISSFIRKTTGAKYEDE